MRSCHRCGGELHVAAKVVRTEGCPHCHSDLKCCLNCALHDPGANNQCREPQAEWVTDKDKANFCEFFEFRDRSSPNAVSSRPKDARTAFDSLFKR
jgi:hypothetical protein